MIYRREIDGLRALAVLPVILFHAGISTFQGGFVGVDIFFVISGYLITTILLSEMSQGRFSITHFYERRARRILPALYFVMLCCLPFAWYLLPPTHLEDFSESAATVTLFLSNVLFWSESGYFGVESDLKPLLHTWSLAVEEQYYLLFPLLLMGLWRFRKRWTFLALILISLVSLLSAHWGAEHAPSATFFLLHTRFWELGIGAITAFILKYHHKEPFQTDTQVSSNISTKVSAECLSLLGLLGIGYAIVAFDDHTPFPSLYTLIPTLGTALIILFATPNTVAGRLLGVKPLVGIGLISYSAYLWHQPLFAFARHYSFYDVSTHWFLLLCALALSLAYLTWRFIESPFRDKQRISRRALFAFTLAGGTFFLTLGITGDIQNGFEERYVRNQTVPKGDINHIDFHRYLDETYHECTPTHLAQEAPRYAGYVRCKQSKEDKKIDIALIGDSHAEHLFIGVSEALHDKNVVYYLQNKKPLLSTPDFDNIFEHVTHEPSIQTVILTMHYFKKLEDFTSLSELEKALDQTTGHLIAQGKNVILIGDVPRFQFDPFICAYSITPQNSGLCESPISEINIINEAFLKRIANKNRIEYIQIDDLICQNSICNMAQGDTLLYRDSHHLNIPGSRYVGSAMIERTSLLSPALTAP